MAHDDLAEQLFVRAGFPGFGTKSCRSGDDAIADVPFNAHSLRMIRKIAAAMLLAVPLGGCSYNYNLFAKVRNGQIVIDVDPASSRQPTCLRQIEVSVEDERDPTWRESVSHDDKCANEFPLSYGHRLRGKHQQDREEVAAKPLQLEVIYEVTTTTGATGYGGGRFIVHADGNVENLPPKLLTSDTGDGS
ncbi:hypothetical protein [Novosphingobium sp.]|uniref:hypothetical protein n=1 Tax=Novosphingobium sp. TaxID=1874826 RepID=UPI002631E3C8|nr:hypothetical protein [Novosphingobium sp.]